MACQRAEHPVILTLCAYGVLTVLVPALWICARLWFLRNANRELVDGPMAQVIHFPSDFRRYMPRK